MKNWIMRGVLLLISRNWSMVRNRSDEFHDQGKVPIDTYRQILQEVVVQAYEQNRRLSEVPVAVGVITTAEWNRYSKMSIVPAMNSIPGVRMEERSPGSYRLSFRGSTLRSPFGVRNVKVYLERNSLYGSRR